VTRKHRGEGAGWWEIEIKPYIFSDLDDAYCTKGGGGIVLA